MSNKLMLTRHQLQIILMSLAAATHSTNAISGYLTLKSFFEKHPDQQVFALSATKEGRS